MRGSTIKAAPAACVALALSCCLWLGLAAPASAAPRWDLGIRSNSAVAPGSDLDFGLSATNVGDAEMIGTLTLTAELPEGITALGAASGATPSGAPWSCTGDGPGAPPKVNGASNVTCTLTDDFSPGSSVGRVRIKAHVASLAEGLVRVPRFALYASSSTLRDGTPCADAPPGTACASIVDPIRIDSNTHFGFEGFEAPIEKWSGEPETKAGVHPYAQSTYFDLQMARNGNIEAGGENDDEAWPVEEARNVLVELPPGFIGNPTAVPTCTLAELSANCPEDSRVGMNRIRFNGATGATGGIASASGFNVQHVFNMVPAPGYAARLGFNVVGTIVVIDVGLERGDDYGLLAGPRGIPQALAVTGNDLTVWGITPAGDAFLRAPTSCQGPLQSEAHADSWKNPGAFEADGSPDLFDPAWDSTSSTTHELPGFPHLPSEWGEEVAMDGCELVPVKGNLSAQPTAIETETPSGLQVRLDVPNSGLENPEGIAASDLEKVEVKLPAGMTVNPSQAEGLGSCSPQQYESTELSFFPTPGKGCPDDSKIGTVEVQTPLLEETIPGDVYVATPYQNPFSSLLALYVVLHEPQRGVLVKLAGKVEADPKTGQLTATFDDLPQTPFSTFDFRFREGARAPLVTPQACGTYESVTRIWGHSDPNGTPLTSTSSFTIDRGIGGAPCPTGGIPPFKPGLIAGSRNNAAGWHSPFDLRLFRSDAEQQFTNFSIKLPPGVTGKLAGIPLCPDAAIAAAKGRTGAEELAVPSCPAGSYVGHTLVGAGVGSVQTYVPGKVYLAGPYNGSALSIVAITAAKVGPFDLGTVVVRQALRIDRTTAEVFIDPTGSDPLPHIIDGIPTKLRDIRVYVDRPDFVLNPTSCAPTSVASTVLGSGLDFASAHDDEPVVVSTRFQAADCAALAFKPRLGLRLFGKTKRGGNPKFRAVLRMEGSGESNIAKAQVTLPRSVFLDQSHINTVCTRVQYAQDTCPKGSVYGHAVAHTPLLDGPLAGPVYLRSSSNKLPDLVAALKHDRIEIDLVGRIDSPGKGGRIRNTFDLVPDAPVTKFILTMKGGNKSLIQNSANLCRGKKNRAVAKFDAHNGKIRDFRPVVRPRCGKKKRKRARRSSHKRAGG